MYEAYKALSKLTESFDSAVDVRITKAYNAFMVKYAVLQSEAKLLITLKNTAGKDAKSQVKEISQHFDRLSKTAREHGMKDKQEKGMICKAIQTLAADFVLENTGS